MRKLVVLGALALGIAVTPRAAEAAHHEPVIQVVTVEVTPGQLDAYRAEVKKLAAVIARVDSEARLRMWETTAGGEDAGAILVAVEYANEAAWAADSARTQSDPEWRKIVAGLHGMRTVVSTSIWRDVSPSPVAGGAGGGVLVLTGVAVQPGKLEQYRKLVGDGKAIVERLGLTSQLRMWRAELAGPSTGSVAVGVQYPDLATYVADQAKLAGDAEWQKLLAALDAVRTIEGRWLYREITP